MADIRPMTFQWDGEAMRPLNPKGADEQYVVGERYRLAPFEERSQSSHGHFFAALNEAWKNLPEDIAARVPSSEHLRKWALVKAGYRDEKSIVCTSAEDAPKVAALIKTMDDLAIVVVHECTVTVYTAKSQSVHAMGKADFQKSKQAVLDIVSQLIGTDAATLRTNAARAA